MASKKEALSAVLMPCVCAPDAERCGDFSRQQWSYKLLGGRSSLNRPASARRLPVRGVWYYNLAQFAWARQFSLDYDLSFSQSRCHTFKWVRGTIWNLVWGQFALFIVAPFIHLQVSLSLQLLITFHKYSLHKPAELSGFAEKKRLDFGLMI